MLPGHQGASDADTEQRAEPTRCCRHRPGCRAQLSARCPAGTAALGGMASSGRVLSLVFTSHPGFCSQDLTLKLCLIRSICMISQAIYNGAKCGDFVFSRKAELVAQMVVRARPGGGWARGWSGGHREGSQLGTGEAGPSPELGLGVSGTVTLTRSAFQEFIKAEPLETMRTPVRQRAMITCTYLVYPPPCGKAAGRAVLTGAAVPTEPDPAPRFAVRV